MDESRILKIMYDGAGAQFDPQIIDIFRKLHKSGEVAKAAVDQD